MINIWTWRDEISGFVIVVRMATRGRTKTCLCHSFKKTSNYIRYYTRYYQNILSSIPSRETIYGNVPDKKKKHTRIPCAGLLLYMIYLETKLTDEIDWGSLLSFLIKKLPSPKKLKCVGVGGFMYNILTGI